MYSICGDAYQCKLVCCIDVRCAPNIRSAHRCRKIHSLTADPTGVAELRRRTRNRGFTEVRRGCPPFQGWEESPLQLLLNEQAFDLVFLSGALSLPREIGEIGRTVRGRKAPVVTVHRWRLNLEAQLGPPRSCHPTARGGHRQEPRGGNRDPEPRSRDAMISIMGSASPSQGQAACFSWRRSHVTCPSRWYRRGIRYNHRMASPSSVRAPSAETDNVVIRQVR